MQQRDKQVILIQCKTSVSSTKFRARLFMNYNPQGVVRVPTLQMWDPPAGPLFHWTGRGPEGTPAVHLQGLSESEFRLFWGQHPSSQNGERGLPP